MLYVVDGSSDVVWMGAPPNRVELFKSVLGGDFRRAFADRVTVEWGDLRVSVVSYDALIALKRAAGRAQDLADIANLETTKK